jgi:hypothetical protein
MDKGTDLRPEYKYQIDRPTSLGVFQLIHFKIVLSIGKDIAIGLENQYVKATQYKSPVNTLSISWHSLNSMT